MEKPQTISDKAQLRLRMTEEQILAIRAEDKVKAQHANGERFFNEENKMVWAGITRRNAPPKGKGHWLYWADQARTIAASKTEKKHRKYWNKVAKRYEENIDGTS